MVLLDLQNLEAPGSYHGGCSTLTLGCAPPDPASNLSVLLCP
jgi:hypothetical protein